jgi:hypothetical protein
MMVREYILTSREREILQRFLEKGEKLNGFSSLIYYLKRSKKTLETDLKLINETLKHLNGEMIK